MYKTSRFNVSLVKNRENLLYNSFSKACIKINEDGNLKQLVDKINSGVQLKDDEIEVFNVLKTNGFLVDDFLDEVNAVEYIFKKRYFDLSKLNLILLPTLKCNFNCPYCFEKGFNKFKEEKFYFDALKKYVDSVIGGLTHIHISMFGGEPLLFKDKMLDFIEYVYQKTEDNRLTLDTSIVTNGSLICENVIEKLIKYNCKYIQITLDGDKNKHDETRCFSNGKPSFNILIEKIHLVAKMISKIPTFKLIVRINLNNINAGDIEKTLLLIEETYRENIYLLFRSVFNTEEYNRCNSNMNSELDEFYAIGKKLGYNILKNKRFFSSCEACGDANTFHILPDLSLRKCINCSLLPDCLGVCILHNSMYKKRVCSNFDMNSTPYQY